MNKQQSAEGDSFSWKCRSFGTYRQSWCRWDAAKRGDGAATADAQGGRSSRLRWWNISLPIAGNMGLHTLPTESRLAASFLLYDAQIRPVCEALGVGKNASHHHQAVRLINTCRLIDLTGMHSSPGSTLSSAIKCSSYVCVCVSICVCAGRPPTELPQVYSVNAFWRSTGPLRKRESPRGAKCSPISVCFRDHRYSHVLKHRFAGNPEMHWCVFFREVVTLEGSNTGG